MCKGKGKIERISSDHIRCLLKTIYEVRSIAHGLTVGVGREYDALVILDTGEVGGLVHEAEHFVDAIARGIVHRAFAGLVDAGGCWMRWIEGAGMVVEQVVGKLLFVSYLIGQSSCGSWLSGFLITLITPMQRC